MPYLSLTEEEKKAMLGEIGVRSFDELIKDIPAALRNPKIDLPPSLTEPEIQDLIKKLGRRNTTTQDVLSFLGAGSYEHFIPAAALEITGRQEFLTAYTPYQPEIAQGTVRFSFGHSNTDEDVDYLIKILPAVVKRLREMSPLHSQNKGKK